MNIYVASSWRNDFQPEVVKRLRAEGHEVYDFKNPSVTNHGFHWSEIDHNWQEWTSQELRDSLQNSPIAQDGFDSDYNAMKAANACVMVMPCGRSAHLEAGYFIGAGKPCIIYLTKSEPELMYKMANAICLDMDEVVGELKKYSNSIKREFEKDVSDFPKSSEIYNTTAEWIEGIQEYVKTHFGCKIIASDLSKYLFVGAIGYIPTDDITESEYTQRFFIRISNCHDEIGNLSVKSADFRKILMKALEGGQVWSTLPTTPGEQDESL